MLRIQCRDQYKSKYKKVGVQPLRIVKSNVSSVGPLRQRETDEGPTVETLDFTNSVSAVHQPFYI